MIHTDGTHNELIHKRTMFMEIAGHEFWGLDGETIWYDWQPPKGENFFLAGYNLQTHKRTAYHMQRNGWSIHFNLTQDLDLFTGDGGDPGQVAKAPDGECIELFYPRLLPGPGAINDPIFWQPGVFASKHLVNMAVTTIASSPTSASRPTRSSSSSPATCSVQVTYPASRLQRPQTPAPPTSIPPPTWPNSSTQINHTERSATKPGGPFSREAKEWVLPLVLPPVSYPREGAFPSSSRAITIR